jgi:hypothetical protein
MAARDMRLPACGTVYHHLQLRMRRRQDAESRRMNNALPRREFAGIDQYVCRAGEGTPGQHIIASRQSGTDRSLQSIPNFCIRRRMTTKTCVPDREIRSKMV